MSNTNEPTCKPRMEHLWETLLRCKHCGFLKTQGKQCGQCGLESVFPLVCFECYARDEARVRASLAEGRLIYARNALDETERDRDNSNKEIGLLRAELARVREELAATKDERKIAPVQGYAPGIPWSMHLRAYGVYAKKYGQQTALIEGWCRGGFGTGELDEFIPGWRAELSELLKLKRRAEAAEAALATARPTRKQLSDALSKLEEYSGGYPSHRAMARERVIDMLAQFTRPEKDQTR